MAFAEDFQTLGGADEVHDAIMLRYWTEHFYLCLSNIVRIGLGDKGASDGSNNDWYQPLLQSIYALQEHHYRLRLNLPLLLDDQQLLAITQFIAGVCRRES